MQNLKTHNILRNHIDHIKEIYTENELLKHIIENLKDENAKLTKNISVKQNMMRRENNNQLKHRENNNQLKHHENNYQLKHRENNNSFKNKLLSWQPLKKELLFKQLFEKELLKTKEYNPSENLEINKLRAPKLLFILYK